MVNNEGQERKTLRLGANKKDIDICIDLKKNLAITSGSLYKYEKVDLCGK